MKRSTSVCQNSIVLIALIQTVKMASSMKLQVPLSPPKEPCLVFYETPEEVLLLVLVVCVQSELYDCQLNRGDHHSVSSASEQFVPPKHHRTTTKDFMEPC